MKAVQAVWQDQLQGTKNISTPTTKVNTQNGYRTMQFYLYDITVVY